MLHYEKSQNSIKKNNLVNRSFKPDDSVLKILELQKKLKIVQDEADRLKREKEEKKKEEQPLSKQVKILELKIK